MSAIPVPDDLETIPEPTLGRKPWWARPWFLMLGLMLITAVPYLQLANQAFSNYDDPIFVYENVVINQGLTWEGVRYAFSFSGLTQWHPLTFISHMIDVELFGMWAGGHKLHSLALHLANTLLLFGILRAATGKTERAAAVALLWAIHPLRVEVVAWVAERKQVLATFFAFGSILCYVWYARKPSVGRYAAVWVLFLLSLLAKPAWITLPCVLLLMDFWPLRRVERFWTLEERPKVIRLILEKLPMLPLVAFLAYMTLRASEAAHTISSDDAYPLSLRIANAFVAYIVYIRKTVLPNDLSVLYLTEYHWPAIVVALCVTLLIVLTWLSCRQYAKRPYILVGWLWFLGTLVPMIGIIQVGGQKYADRYTYIAGIGLVIIAVWGGSELLKRFALQPLIRRAGFAALVAVLLFATWLQTSYWVTSITLFHRAVDQEGNNPIALTNLGAAYYDAGFIDTAKIYYEKALRHDPDRYEATMNMGLIAGRENRHIDAIQYFRRAIRVNSRYPAGYHNLGAALMEIGREDMAERAYSHALKLDPRYWQAHTGLAVLDVHRGKYEEAMRHYDAAIALQPNRALPYLRKADGLFKLGHREESIALLRRTLDRFPDSAMAREALTTALNYPATQPWTQPASQPGLDESVGELLPPPTEPVR